LVRILSDHWYTVDLLRDAIASQVTATFLNGVSTAAPALDIEIVHIDASRDTIRLQDLYGRFDNPEDIINGSGARLLAENELENLNYLAKREYREIKLYEVEINDETMPFFEVTLGPARYDSRTMGAGEFAAFFLWWNLARAARNSILLIEEPETFLCSYIQCGCSPKTIERPQKAHLKRFEQS